MAGTRDKVEGLPWFRAARAVSVGVDLDAMDRIDTATLVDRARCLTTEDPADGIFEYDQDSVLAASVPNVVAPTSNVGRWLLKTIAGASAYLTQIAWYVNSATGDDGNDGLTALTALKTLAELERRWTGRTFAPAVTAVTVNLAGTFPTEELMLAAIFTAPTAPAVVTVLGLMTTVDAGTVTGYAAWNSAGDIRGAVTDAAQDFTAHVRRRIRINSAGAALGGVTHIGSLGGGVTIANVGQFRTLGPGFTGANVNPIAGVDTYVIETYNTQIRGYTFSCLGARVILQDVEVAPPAAQIGYCTSHQTQGLTKIAGCSFVGSAGGATICQGPQTWVACSVSGTTMEFKEGFWNTKALCMFTTLAVYNAMWQADATMHDGNGANRADLDLEQGATLLDTAFRAFFGCTATGQLVIVNNAAYWSLGSACYFWGALGNLTTNALKVTNGSGVYYTAGAVPKATGVVPGNDVVLAGAAAIAWAGVPAAAVPPDNAVVALKQ